MSPLLSIALLALASAEASTPPSIEGRWRSPGGNTIIEIAPCGPNMCGTVAWASAKAQRDSRKTTPQLIGTQLLTGLKQDSNGRWLGKLFIPDKNLRVTAKIEAVGEQMKVSGCAAGKALCKSESWNRLTGALPAAE